MNNNNKLDLVSFFMLPDNGLWARDCFTGHDDDTVERLQVDLARAIRHDQTLLDLKREWDMLVPGMRGNPAKREAIKARWAQRIEQILIALGGQSTEASKPGEIFYIESAHILMLPRGTRFRYVEDDGYVSIIKAADPDYFDQVA